MAKSFVSPGVRISEIDQSFLGAGVEQIGASILGTATKGPAFVPITVSSFEEFTQMFGSLDEDHKATYAAKAYLNNSSTLNFVRVLGPEGTTDNTGATVTPGYTAESVFAIVGITGSSTARIHATLEVTGAADMIVTDLTGDEFFLALSDSNGESTGLAHATSDGFLAVTASFLTSSDNYIKKVTNSDPTKFSDEGHYLKDVYDYALFTHARGASGTPGQAVYSSASLSTMTNFQFPFLSASTPWIKSQEFGGGKEYNLFRLHTLGHGDAENGRFKISVTDVQPSVVPSTNPFGTFGLQVRKFADSDKAPAIVESYDNLSLNPTDRNYILKRIGNQYLTYDNSSDQEKMVVRGDYETKSDFIRVELTTGSFPDEALPWGFKGLDKPDLTYISGSSTEEGELSADVVDILEDLPYVKDLNQKTNQSLADSNTYWGVEFDLSGSVKARLSRFPTMTGSDAEFSLKLVSGSALTSFVYNTSNPAASKKAPGDSDDHTTLDPKHAKFTLPLAFGFDGFDNKVEDPLDNDTQLTATTQIGVQALRQAVDVISDPDFIDINLLSIPGIYSDQVVEYAIDAVENRADTFYVADVSGSSVDDVVSEVKGRGFDTNYAGLYYPGAKVVDTVNGNQRVNVPASVLALGAISYNDRVAHPWFAPAGLNRGGLNADTIGFSIANPDDFLKKANRDKLYQNRINPIATFPGVNGLTIWGQKTLQAKESALDRVNVRRLVIKAKKLIASATKFLVFEPINPRTFTRFKQLVNPILQDIQIKNGLEQFVVVIDSSTTTPDLIDRNTMKAVLKIVPTRAAEAILIDLVISRSGAEFEE